MNTLLLKTIFVSLVSALVLSTRANAAPVTTLEITGGNFTLDIVNNVYGSFPVSPGAYSNLTIGGYDGSPPPTNSGIESLYSPYSIATFQPGFFGPFGIYTAYSDGGNSGYAPVTGDITDNILTLDLSAWTVFWNGITYNMGSSSDMAVNSVCQELGSTGTINCSTAITTTYNAALGTFSASWDAVHLSYDTHTAGGFAGTLSRFEITGNVSAVPAPAPIWLFGSGLIALVGFSRRKKI